jgi:DNA-binding MarR family transcriptional regulator
MPNYLAMTKQSLPARASSDDVLAAFAAFRPRMDSLHMPDFLGVDVTMSQAKILLLLVSAHELHMSELVRRLGISLSTVSGHVDRLVEQGLVARRADPADRRQVVVAPTRAALELAQRFDQINSTQLRLLVDDMTPLERGDIARAFGHLTRAIDRHVSGGAPVAPDERTAS